jgi:hypothetical protein
MEEVIGPESTLDGFPIGPESGVGGLPIGPESGMADWARVTGWLDLVGIVLSNSKGFTTVGEAGATGAVTALAGGFGMVGVASLVTPARGSPVVAELGGGPNGPDFLINGVATEA